MLTTTCFAPDLLSWRKWLQENHAVCTEVWLVFWRASTERPCVTYDDALDEALCFGWIDSLIQRIDDEKYARKFTPRTNTGNWSAANKQRALRLLAEGRMREEGRAVLPDEDALRDLAPRQRPQLAQLPEFAEALSGNRDALATWQRLAPSLQRNYIGWISSAKRAETRARRVQEALRLLAEGKPLTGK